MYSYLFSSFTLSVSKEESACLYEPPETSELSLKSDEWKLDGLGLTVHKAPSPYPTSSSSTYILSYCSLFLKTNSEYAYVCAAALPKSITLACMGPSLPSSHTVIPKARTETCISLPNLISLTYK
jgi:hypothetical protein